VKDAEETEEAVAACVAQCHMARLLELLGHEPAFAVVAGPLPQATELARLQAQGVGPVTNLRQRLVNLNDDGSRSCGCSTASAIGTGCSTASSRRCGRVGLSVARGGRAVTDEEDLRGLLPGAMDTALLRLGHACFLLR